MLCDKCKSNEANVKYQIIINGNKDSMNLCNDCAGKMGISLSFKQNEMEVNDFIASVFGSGLGQHKVVVKKCEVCGYELASYNKSGLLGCDKCYDSFRKELEPAIRKMHGNINHIGLKEGLSDLINKEKELSLNSIRMELQQAICTENFELAAQLRDKIKEMEGQVIAHE